MRKKHLKNMHLKDKTACVTLDLESDYSGNVSERYDAWTEENISTLLSLLKQYDCPLTVFVVANTLQRKSKIIRLLQRQRVEFHLHSYSHDLDNPDSKNEIQKGIEAYEAFFGKPPSGYRAPQGLISNNGMKDLKKQGFEFDASVFPSFWPSLHYFTFPLGKYIDKASGLLEIPFTVIRPFRLIFALSWVKLLGWRFYRFLINQNMLPDQVNFNLHLHDLWILPSYKELPYLWKWVYGRNGNKGLIYLEHVLDLLRSKGYRFVQMKEYSKGSDE